MQIRAETAACLVKGLLAADKHQGAMWGPGIFWANLAASFSGLMTCIVRL